MPDRYGHAHRRARAKWADLVAQGGVECCELVCLKSSRLINPDEPWHLAHTPDGDAYLGPAHAECNTSEGARRGNRTRISPSQSQIEGSIPLVGDAHYPAPASHPSPQMNDWPGTPTICVDSRGWLTLPTCPRMPLRR